MCNRKHQTRYLRDSNIPRFEITCQPEAVTFRDEGGQSNYLFVFFVLRPGVNGYPDEIMKHKYIEVEASLEYGNGTRIIDCDREPLKVLGEAGSTKLDKTEETKIVMLDTNKMYGSLRYKINVLTRNHHSQAFRVKINLLNIPETVAQAAYTDCTYVYSKRKWMKAFERTPENERRSELENEAAIQNAQLAKSLNRCGGSDLSIREMTKLKLNKSYPDCQGLGPKKKGTVKRERTTSNETIEVIDNVASFQPHLEAHPAKRSKFLTPKRGVFVQQPSLSPSQPSVAEDAKFLDTNDTVQYHEKMIRLLVARVTKLEKQLSELKDETQRAPSYKNIFPTSEELSRADSLILADKQDSIGLLVPNFLESRVLSIPQLSERQHSSASQMLKLDS